jgi:hypothetical protein
MIRASVLRERRTGLLLRSMPYVAALVATLWIFRGIAAGNLPGDRGDARWTISFHEHWYDVWRGRASIRDLAQFYPFQDMLGSADPLLVQGQVYSLARAAGGGLIDSWVVAQIVTYAFGLLGLAAVSRRFLATWWAQVGFVLITGVSYPVALQAGHVQLFAIFWPSWLVLAASNIASGRSKRLSWLSIAVLPPALAMSSWYVFVLSTFTALALLVVLVVFHRLRHVARATRSVARALWRDLHDRWVLAAVCLGAAAWAVTAWIFLAGSRALPDPTWTDASHFSPRWSDLLDGGGLGGGVWGPVYRWWYPGREAVTMERREGFVPLLFVALVIATVVLGRSLALRKRSALRPREGVWLLAIGVTCFVVPVFFVTSDDGLSLFKPLWLYVPGLDSIRAPFRVQGIIYAMATFVVVRSVEAWGSTRRPTEGGTRGVLSFKRLTFAGLVLVAMLVETNREPASGWQRDDLLRPTLTERIPAIRSGCDAIILLDEDLTDPEWVLPIDAVTLSVLAGVPTPQGYGRAAPIGFPGNAADPSSLVEWMRSQGFAGVVCSVSSTEVRPLT